MARKKQPVCHGRDGTTLPGVQSHFLLADRWFDGERFRSDPVQIELGAGAIRALRPPSPEAVPTARGFDARGELVLPGLIDAHCHLARTGWFEPQEPPNPEAVARNLRTALAAGVTTAGDMGCTWPLIEDMFTSMPGPPMGS